MSIPEEIAAIVAERQEARAARDFARADALRDKLTRLGWVLTDTAEGPRVERAPRFTPVDPATVADGLDAPASLAWSLHLLWEGFADDLRRFLDGVAAHCDTSSLEIVVVDNASGDGEFVEDLVEPFAFARALHLDREVGWAAARNAGLKTSAGALVALVDLSVEPVGDILTPLARAFDDPAVGLAGPFGLVSDDLRDWRSSDGPRVDALEGYLLAARRELLARGLVHERFAWYRNADIDLSFQLRSLGYDAVVVPLPVLKHAHRGWEALDPEERARRSKRNHYTFFDRWKGRTDLLTGAR